MAIRRCRKCRQPVLATQGICPHCAVARPVARLGPRAILVALLLAAILVSALLYRGRDRAPAGAPEVATGARR